MNDERLADIEALVNRATPGPWIDLMRTYSERCQADRKEHGDRWYHGSQAASLPLALIVRDSYHGEPIDPADVPRRVDKFDLDTVISLFWSSLPKRTTIAHEGFLRDEDAAFIAASRTIVPELIAEVRRLQAILGAAPLMLEALEASEEVARLQKPLVDSLNHADTTSGEVRQEASDRLLAAQKQWWALRGRALKAARRTEDSSGYTDGT